LADCAEIPAKRANSPAGKAFSSSSAIKIAARAFSPISSPTAVIGYVTFIRENDNAKRSATFHPRVKHRRAAELRIRAGGNNENDYTLYPLQNRPKSIPEFRGICPRAAGTDPSQWRRACGLLFANETRRADEHSSRADQFCES